MQESPTLEYIMDEDKNQNYFGKTVKTYQPPTKHYELTMHKYNVIRQDADILMCWVDVIRMLSCTLGPGVLGRHYTGTSSIHLSDEYLGEEGREIELHEIGHYMNPQRSEADNREFTRHKLDNPKYH
jgi:hypothetical protein